MRISQWWSKHDPGAAAAKRALKAAVVVGGNFTIASQVFANAQMATFGAFGSFALMMFANFPGARKARGFDYAGLGLLSVGLISLGTVTGHPDWLAVVVTLLVAFGVLFVGVVSSVVNGGTQAALLTFLLAALLPGGVEVLPDRLAGWALAWIVAVPVSLFVWPPNDADRLRSRAADACRRLGDLLALRRSGPGDPLVAVSQAMTGLRSQFRVTAVRFTSLSSANRLVIRLVDELEWLSTTVMSACADAPERWPPKGRELRTAAADLLTAAADVLDTRRPVAATALAGLITRLRAARVAVAQETLSALQSSASGSADTAGISSPGEFERPLYAAHELGYTVTLAGETVAAIARADARTWWERVLGRNRPLDDDRPPAALQVGRLAQSHLSWRSAWLRNSIRGAAGLALAVLLARLFDAQNAFWIGLGALSVLRSNALATGSIAVRALLGTLVGFAVGGVLVAVIGTDHAVLWPLLPVVIFVAGVAPAMISFLAGQAAFTVFSIILFNLLAPIGWRVGIVRVEDVALGCLASLVAGSLFWPRGSGPALSAALADAYRSGADYLHRAVTGLLGPDPDSAVDPPDAGAAHRLDDAFRQYLAETGAKRVPLGSVVALTNGAARLRLAGLAVLGVRLAPSVKTGVTATAWPPGLEQPARSLHTEVDAVQTWFRELADIFAGAHRAVPAIESSSESFLDVLLPVIDRCGDPERAAGAERLLWAGQYVGDVDRVRRELVQPADQVRQALAEPWWHR